MQTSKKAWARAVGCSGALAGRCIMVLGAQVTRGPEDSGRPTEGVKSGLYEKRDNDVLSVDSNFGSPARNRREEKKGCG